MLCAGNTFLIKRPPYETEYLFIALAENNGKILLVNVTSSQSDLTCKLFPGNHRFIKHISYINYKDAMMPEVSIIEETITQRIITPHDDVTPVLLERIIAGAKVSPNFNPLFLPCL